MSVDCGIYYLDLSFKGIGLKYYQDLIDLTGSWVAS
jgi:hypothetical protein